jgi:hypothetical protein
LQPIKRAGLELAALADAPSWLPTDSIREMRCFTRAELVTQAAILRQVSPAPTQIGCESIEAIALRDPVHPYLVSSQTRGAVWKEVGAPMRVRSTRLGREATEDPRGFVRVRGL